MSDHDTAPSPNRQTMATVLFRLMFSVVVVVLTIAALTVVRDGSRATRKRSKKSTAHACIPTPTVTIDHEGFPHIIEAILHHSTPRTRAAFSATCKRYRAQMAATVQHVHFRPGDHFARPALSSVATNAPVPLIPALVQVLDLYGTYWNYASQKRMGRGFRNWFVRLHTVRRFLPSTRPSTSPTGNSLGRLMNVPTLVDYIDLDPLPSWYSYRPILDIRTCSHRYVIHLRWRDDVPYRFPKMLIKFADPAVSVVIVLWPQLGAGAGTSRREYLLDFLGTLVPSDIRSYTLVGPAWLWPSPTSVWRWRFVLHREWMLRLGDDGALIGRWADAPSH